MLPNEGYIEMEDGVRLFFRKAGNGPNTVLIPNGMYLFDDFQRFADSRMLVFYDVRNRGLSDSVKDNAKLAGGVLQDVEDLDVVRRHLGINELDLIGHSYIGLMVGLYAMKYPDHVKRMIQIGPPQPDAGKEYPAHLTGADAVMADVFSRLTQLQKEKRPEDPEEACNKFWLVLREIYVYNPANAGKIDWGRCHLPNERNLMRYWTGIILPSIQKIHLTAEQLANVKSQVLIIHGDKDRSSPYGGARDWGMIWPDARLLTVEDVGHAPWIEAPEVVFHAIGEFLEGRWPKAAEKVKSLQP